MPFARSVFGAVAHPTTGRIFAFGGEVDPSMLGHEGAGDFCADLTCLNLVKQGRGGGPAEFEEELLFGQAASALQPTSDLHELQ